MKMRNHLFSVMGHVFCIQQCFAGIKCIVSFCVCIIFRRKYGRFVVSGPSPDKCLIASKSHKGHVMPRVGKVYRLRYQIMTSSNGGVLLSAGNSPVFGKFPSKRPVTRGFDVSLIWAWTNGWVNNRDAGDLRRHRAHYDVTVMIFRRCSIVLRLCTEYWCNGWTRFREI